MRDLSASRLRKVAPLQKRFGSVSFEILAAVEVFVSVEMIVN